MKNAIEIRKVSITELDTDAIVNAANEALAAGGGVCGAIFKAAGYKELQAACDEIGHCETGGAVITPGFRLRAKYVIHAVGPIWRGGKSGEPEKLESAYKTALEIALANNCRSIGFPLISAGIFGYPLDRAWYDALSACREFLDAHPHAGLHIIFAVLDDKIMAAGKENMISSGARFYKIAEKSDWKTCEMPKRQETFILHLELTDGQMENLRHGNIPKEMEDKWFWYMEGNTLYAHRSWTGYCIYRIDFKPDNHHVVTANRDPEQFTNTSVEEDKKHIIDLLNWWTQQDYDYYHEWLSETVAALEKEEKGKGRLKIKDREVDAVYFHRPEEPCGWLSNWYLSPFDLDGQHFTSMEQYIMYRKCMVFGDRASAEAILATDDVATQKEIGRNAVGYIDTVWAGMRQIAAYEGLLAKFGQNPDLKEKLLNTGDAFLVECAGSDRIWACGIRLNDDRRCDMANWKGKNILGFALMEVRNKLSK